MLDLLMENLKQLNAIYIMKSPEAWDRFMRFMERYSETNGLSFYESKLIKIYTYISKYESILKDG